MRPQGVGAQKRDDASYLAHDWYTRLSDKQLAAYIRYLFIYFREGAGDWDSPAHTRTRPHWDGGKDNFGTKYKAIWEKIAKLIKANRAIPGVWVAAHFSDSFSAVRSEQGKNLTANQPALLCSPVSLEVYRTYLENFDEQARRQYTLAEASVATRYAITEAFKLPEDDHVLLVLCDTSHVNATPFFRHAFATYLNCPRAIGKFIWPAAVEYETRQYLYDGFIERNPDLDWLASPELKKEVVEIRKHWSAYA